MQLHEEEDEKLAIEHVADTAKNTRRTNRNQHADDNNKGPSFIVARKQPAAFSPRGSEGWCFSEANKIYPDAGAGERPARSLFAGGAGVSFLAGRGAGVSLLAGAGPEDGTCTSRASTSSCMNSGASTSGTG